MNLDFHTIYHHYPVPFKYENQMSKEEPFRENIVGG